MPYRPLRPCPAPGCPRLLRPGERCPEHAPQPFDTSTYRTRRAIPDSLRRMILARDQHRCRICGQHGNHVDHITPRSLGGTDTPDNLATLCREHHAIKTATEANRARQAAANARTTREPA